MSLQQISNFIEQPRLQNVWPGTILWACRDGVKSAISQVRNFAWYQSGLLPEFAF